MREGNIFQGHQHVLFVKSCHLERAALDLYRKMPSNSFPLPPAYQK